jgi:branched-subunit amino acid aminotransferase/4-amino-4-deoxychorismate lyase
LHGVTRASILELAPTIGIPVEERDLTVDELLGADEAFLTATSVGVWPVVKIDDHEFQAGEVGPLTQRLREKHRRIAAGDDPEFGHWLTYCIS